MKTINTLLNEYYTKKGKNLTEYPKRSPYEQTTPEYDKTRRQETNRRRRQAILIILINEIPIHITETQTEQIRYWIDTFNPTFKEFHRQASDETIILALIFIQAKHANPKTKLKNYKITEKYNLTTSIFTTIQNRLIFKLMQTTPLTYNLQTRLNHEILQKGKGD